MKLDGLHLAHDITTRNTDEVFYSSDGDNIYKNTAAGMRSSLNFENSAMIPASSTNLASNIVVRNASGDFSAGVIDANGSALSSLNASNLTTGTVSSARLTLIASDIPSLNASKITAGSFGTDRIPSLNASKITTGSFDTDRIPSLNASKINDGQFDAARIPNLNASKINDGQFDAARIPTLNQNTTGNAATASSCSGNSATATNADQLDGYQATQFLRRDVDDWSNGKVGIGTDAPNARLDVQGTGASPVSSGTSSAGIMRARATNTNVVLDQGALPATPWSWWMQVSDSTNLNLKYSLGLNPLGGYVGIGTAEPGYNLHVKGGGGCWVMTETTSGALENRLKGSTCYWSIWNNGSDDKLRFWSGFPSNSTGDRVTFTGGGRVGIGTTSPQSILHVHGGVSGTLGGYPNYYGKGGYSQDTWNRGQGSVGGAYGIYGNYNIGCSGLFISSMGSLTASDERIKKNIVDADDAECLETLRLLKPKKYQYRDVIRRSEEPVWGFIAQEVKETLPHATQLIQEVLPNIYELANVSQSNVITFTNFNTSNLESNATTLIRVIGIDDEDHDIHLVEVIDEHTIRVEEDLSAWTGSVDETGNVVDGNQLFVHGQQVDDFVYLKKESIFTVATAALQEVDKQQQADKARIAELEAQLASVLVRVTTLENM